MRTLEADEAVDVTDAEDVVGAKQLQVPHRRRRPVPGGCCAGWGGQHHGDVVPRVSTHHLAGGDRPVHPLHLPPRELYQHRRRFRRLAVSHHFSEASQGSASPSAAADE